jgi:hypothetical protein
VYRRVATMLFVPSRNGALEMLTIDPAELKAAHERDGAAVETPGTAKPRAGSA